MLSMEHKLSSAKRIRSSSIFLEIDPILQTQNVIYSQLQRRLDTILDP